MHNTLRTELKEALKAKDTIKLAVVRNILSEITNQLVATKRTPQEILPDEEVLVVITRLAKQRKESISQYQNAGRTEQTAQEQAELVVLESYLPAQMSETEIQSYVAEKIATVEISEKKDAGKLVGLIMKDLKGKADGSLVKKIIDEAVAKKLASQE